MLDLESESSYSDNTGLYKYKKKTIIQGVGRDKKGVAGQSTQVGHVSFRLNSVNAIATDRSKTPQNITKNICAFHDICTRMLQFLFLL